jgi:hypothetical protein
MAKKCRETVIDGYNLIHKLWNPGNNESMAALRERIELLLLVYRQKSRQHVTLVYDGGAGAKPLAVSGAIEVVFSGSSRTADRWIIDHVKSMGSRANLVSVVSSDLEIRRYVTAWGGQWISSEAFVEELGTLGILDPAQGRQGIRRTSAGSLKNGSRQLSDVEVDRWLKLFNEKK